LSKAAAPAVAEVLWFQDLVRESLATRRALVRWSDGTEGEVLRYYSDEGVSPVDRVCVEGRGDAGDDSRHPQGAELRSSR
jgi:hypothetical protein